MFRKDFLKVLLQATIYTLVTLGVLVGVNYTVDASSVIRSSDSSMAKLALAGNVVATPENYNERVYQVDIVDNMMHVPDTVVIGSSRGMFLGKDITGYEDIYNNCVSGACVEDYYALLGLYYNRFGELPCRVIIETSPWVLYGKNPESRWSEDKRYHDTACSFYEVVNGVELIEGESDDENPYLSVPYFRYNTKQLIKNGNKVFGDDARVSTNPDEAADYPDGTIRYEALSENESEQRLARVTCAKGAVTYEDSNNMTEIDTNKSVQFEELIEYLLDNGTEVVIYMQPFSVTQCKSSFDEGLNKSFLMAQDYIVDYAKLHGIEVRGGYDARDFGLTDVRFIDSMHLDKQGTKIVWEY